MEYYEYIFKKMAEIKEKPAMKK